MLAFKADVMIDRDIWGPFAFTPLVRDATLGFVRDGLLRKHSQRMFSLIKKESEGIENDQIPSQS